jgi:hypothetical protein
MLVLFLRFNFIDLKYFILTLKNYYVYIIYLSTVENLFTKI